jgi:hypothetical protein
MSDRTDIEAEFKKLAARVEKLERATFGTGKPAGRKSAPATATDDFTGATGGIRLLLSKGFFKTKRLFPEVTSELKAEGYLYSKQAFQAALTRLSSRPGPLATLRENGNKVYAERK